MLKKSVSVLLSLLMVLSVFTVIPFSVNAEEIDTTESGLEFEVFSYTDPDIYVADSLLLGVIDKQGNASGSAELPMAILHNYTYKNLAEAAVDDEALMFNSLFWQNLKKTLSGDFLEKIPTCTQHLTIKCLSQIAHDT